MNSSFTGLVYGSFAHHLDHIAPLCHLFSIPLIVTDEDIKSLCLLYYPMVATTLISPLSLPSYLSTHFSHVISCMPTPFYESLFFLNHSYPTPIWCPHGNSDKGTHTFFMENLIQEKFLLVYGEKMKDFLKEKKALHPEAISFPIGNYRLSFYNQNISFYKNLLNDLIFSKLEKNKPTYLYAPTWEDGEHGSSFTRALHTIIESKPKDINLIIKLHPNTLQKLSPSLEKLLWKYQNNSDMIILDQFPPIYPLLDIIDVYIGDTSSIGYDFLTFKKPMFFLNVQPDLPSYTLYNCGHILYQKDFEQIYAYIEKMLPVDEELYNQKRSELHHYTFSSNLDYNKVLSNLFI